MPGTVTENPSWSLLHWNNAGAAAWAGRPSSRHIASKIEIRFIYSNSSLLFFKGGFWFSNRTVSISSTTFFMQRFGLLLYRRTRYAISYAAFQKLKFLGRLPVTIFNLNGGTAQSGRSHCSISPVELILQSGVRNCSFFVSAQKQYNIIQMMKKRTKRSVPSPPR